ncbi:GNAT family N-acetyltransferase [Bacillus sp. FJAT-49711]|uniref:GNAT family N-acetyltransferase n=1 Tax=Bacillus sp. FJAT-49711 TaxID=2833585 RepID=UPI001BC95FDB|nr:GNAT family N-acetyltransferase [Bacillus sp. FJAT-49711]MBS4218663.1 GNAT family N-acetyltransferase [Bacillus sp. FJAT-49711]
MDYRILMKEDAEIYQKLRLEALQTNPEAFGSTYEREVHFTRKDIEHRIEPTVDKFVLGAFEKESLVATARFVQEMDCKTSHKGYIYGMYVSPSYRGKGIGHELLKRVMEKAKLQDRLEQITLTVVSDNFSAKMLYEKMGFKVFATEKNALKVDDVYYDEDWLVYFLN